MNIFDIQLNKTDRIELLITLFQLFIGLGLKILLRRQLSVITTKEVVARTSSLSNRTINTKTCLILASIGEPFSKKKVSLRVSGGTHFSFRKQKKERTHFTTNPEHKNPEEYWKYIRKRKQKIILSSLQESDFRAVSTHAHCVSVSDQIR